MTEYIFLRDIKPYKKGEKVKLNGFFESYYLGKKLVQPVLPVNEKPLKKRAKKEEKNDESI